MKHANDPGTIEMFDAPKRRGRPPQGKQALTPAERAKRYRRKVQDRAHLAISNPAELATGVLCDALARLATNDFLDEETRAFACGRISAELSKRFPEPDLRRKK